MKKLGTFVIFTFVAVLTGCIQGGAPIFLTGPMGSLCTTPGGLDGSFENPDTYTSPDGLFSVRVPSLGDPRYATCIDEQSPQANTAAFTSDAFWCEGYGVGSFKITPGIKPSSADLFERELRGWRVGQSVKVVERKTTQTRHGLAQFAIILVSGSAPCTITSIRDGIKSTNKIDGIVLGYWLRHGDYGHFIMYYTREKSLFSGRASATDPMRTKLDKFYNNYKPRPLPDG